MAQSLLNQITAYEQNYILVETLLEESKVRAQALETIDKMKEYMQEVYIYLLTCVLLPARALGNGMLTGAYIGDVSAALYYTTT